MLGISEDHGLSLDKVTINMLGFAKKFTVSLDDTIILHGSGDKKLIEERCEQPPKIKSFISSVTATPLENIEGPLKTFVWEFDKGDFHHWVDLFNHFDTYFEKYIKSRKDLQLEDSLLESDHPFPRVAVLQILRVIRIILENCTNKHFYSSYEVVGRVAFQNRRLAISPNTSPILISLMESCWA